MARVGTGRGTTSRADADAELCFQPLARMAQRVRAGEIAPTDLTRAYLDRIERLDGSLGSYLTVLGESALAAAERAERELRENAAVGPLHGVPVAVKDLFDTAGTRTTYGSRIHADHVPDLSATAVARLEAAGAILLGKLHLTEYAFVEHHRDFPPAHNPWDPTRSPGGSSSGSGIATAAGLCAGALGTDTVASIRLPAAWCGTVGLKPSWGRVSRAGVFPLASSLDHVGPLTRSVEDAALLLACIAGPDPRDPSAMPQRLSESGFEARGDLSGLRVGWDAAYAENDVHPDVRAAVANARDAAVSLGAEIVPVEIPLRDAALDIFAPVFATEVRAAHAATFPERADDYTPALARTLRGFGAVDPLLHVEGSVGARAFRHHVARLFEDIDLLLCPTVPVAAPPLPADSPREIVSRELMAAHPNPFHFMRFTCLWNLAATPAIALPWGFDADGLPLSVQLVGPFGRDTDLLTAAAPLAERAPDRDRRPPI